MKHLTIILLFICTGCKAQDSCYVNGVKQPCEKTFLAQKATADSLYRIQYTGDSLAQVKRIATITTLRTKAYAALNGTGVGTTLTTAQQQAALWIALWNAGAINISTNKIDSTQNYIK